MLLFLRHDDNNGMTVAVPAQAIACYERLHGLAVTVHDLDGRLRDSVGAQRQMHRHRACLAAKATGLERCVAFDVHRLREELPHHHDGLVRRCPFAVREAVAWCERDGRCAWILFAGPLRDNGADALEGLRQLRDRLRRWEDDHAAWPRGRRVELGGAAAPDDRKARILRWIGMHHGDGADLDALATHLGLSRFQASRSVRQLCGAPLRDLLTQARLTTAQALLAETALPLADIAVRSGFADRTRLHRAMVAATGSSPAQWRRKQVVSP